METSIAACWCSAADDGAATAAAAAAEQYHAQQHKTTWAWTAAINSSIDKTGLCRCARVRLRGEFHSRQVGVDSWRLLSRVDVLGVASSVSYSALRAAAETGNDDDDDVTSRVSYVTGLTRGHLNCFVRVIDRLNIIAQNIYAHANQFSLLFKVYTVISVLLFKYSCPIACLSRNLYLRHWNNIPKLLRVCILFLKQLFCFKLFRVKIIWPA